MAGAWFVTLKDDWVEVNAYAGSGRFQVATLPEDWRDQLERSDVRHAVASEIAARQQMSWPERRDLAETIDGHELDLSWYSVRARLAPATIAPLAAVAQFRHVKPHSVTPYAKAAN